MSNSRLSTFALSGFIVKDICLLFQVNVNYFHMGTWTLLCCREPGAEQKFKDISNAYEVTPCFWVCVWSVEVGP